MLVIIIGLLLTLALSVLVTVFAAFPDRGEDIPHAQWLSNVMIKTRDKIAR